MIDSGGLISRTSIVSSDAIVSFGVSVRFVDEFRRRGCWQDLIVDKDATQFVVRMIMDVSGQVFAKNALKGERVMWT